MLNIELVYFLAAAAASGVFIAAGWPGKIALKQVALPGRPGMSIDPIAGDGDIHDARADVGAAMRVALKRLAPVMTNQSVQADIAAPAGLPVRMRSGALTDLLEEMLAAAIHGAPASRLLLTAATHGNRIDVGISDDMPGADATARLASVSGLMQRIARRGGTLEVKVRPAEGTTMTLRLTAAAEA